MLEIIGVLAGVIAAIVGVMMLIDNKRKKNAPIENNENVKANTEKEIELNEDLKNLLLKYDAQKSPDIYPHKDMDGDPKETKKYHNTLMLANKGFIRLVNNEPYYHITDMGRTYLTKIKTNNGTKK